MKSFTSSTILFLFALLSWQISIGQPNTLLSGKSIANQSSAKGVQYAARAVQTSLQQPTKQDVLELRDAYSKTYRNADGSFTKEHNYLPIHFQNAEGSWVEFNSTLQVTNNIASVSQTDLPISIDLQSGSTIMVLERNGNSIEFGSETSIERINADGTVQPSEVLPFGLGNVLENNRVVFENATWGMEKIVRAHFSHTETDYKLYTQPGISNDEFLSFTDKLTLPAAWSIEKVNGNEGTHGWEGDLAILNENGVEAGRLHLPRFYDNSFNPHNLTAASTNGQPQPEMSATELVEALANNVRVIKGSYKVEEQNGTYAISVLVPGSWLNNPNVQYPVVIDPVTSNSYPGTGTIVIGATGVGNTATMNVVIPAGDLVTSTDMEWRVVGLNYCCGFVTPSDVDAEFSGNNGSAGPFAGTSVNVNEFEDLSETGLSIANGVYPSGVVPFSVTLTQTGASGNAVLDFYGGIGFSGVNWTATVTHQAPSSCFAGTASPSFQIRAY